MAARNNTPEKFWSRVDRSGDCWIWTGCVNSRGYGHVRWHGGLWQTHRLAYLLTYGSILDGAYVCHRCDNPPCVRPDHLWLGSQLDNMTDMTQKKRYHVMLGEAHPNSRFKDCEVQLIRRMCSSGLPTTFVGRCFKCRPGTIDNLVKHRSRLSVPDADWKCSAAPTSGILRQRLSYNGSPGTANGRCLLSESDVLEIRKRLAAGESPTAVALDYPISREQVYSIKHRRSWAHL